MAVPSSKLIVLNPVIITDQQIDTEGRINICRDHDAVSSVDCSVCARLKITVKNLAQLILSWLLVCWRLSVCVHYEEHAGAVAELVGIEGGVVSGVINLEPSGVEASDWRPRHDEPYHEA